MLIDYQWFQSCFKQTLVDTPEVVAQKLSQAGIEAAFHPYLTKPLPEDLIVGQIVQVTKHPEADRLHCCEVSIGDKILPIICACPSVTKDLLVVLAKPGYVLPDGTVIKQSKIRGLVSEGMLCSPSEIGFDSIYPSDGILKLTGDIQVGRPVSQYLDRSLLGYLEIDVTPNRGDAMSVMGIARVYNSMAQVPLNHMLANESDMPIQLVEHQDAGNSYVHARLSLTRPVVLNGVDQLRVSVAKFDSVNPMVDYLNLMMLQLGQPFHAMDADKISGQIHFRFAKSKEVFEALNGKEYTLTENDWVLADQQGICALAGIMGAQRTAITENSRELLVEAAYFSPTRIAKTSRRLGIMTESSLRFERGVDPYATKAALLKVLLLLQEKTSYDLDLIQAHISDIPSKSIRLTQADVQRVYGQLLDADKIEVYFTQLGFQVQSQPEGWELVPPSYRQDIQSKTEAVESLAIFSSMFVEASGQLDFSYDVSHESYWCNRQDRVKDYLVDQGFCEIINCAIISNKEHERFGACSPIVLDSPMGSLEVMRSNLLPGLLHTAQKDICHHKVDSVRMFEIGNCFQSHNASVLEVSHIGVLCGGRQFPLQSIDRNEIYDFFDLKAIVQKIFGQYFKLSVQYETTKYTEDFFHPYQSASIYYQSNLIGGIGAIHPKILQEYDIPFDCYFAYGHNQILCGPPNIIYRSPSLYPKMTRDISFWVEQNILYQSLDRFFSALKIDYLTQVQCVDRYEQGGRVSYAFRLTFQSHHQTLQDSSIDQQVTKIKDDLSSQLNIDLRS